MKKALLFRLAVLVAAMMCALGAAAAEAYACYTSSNTTLRFYYDKLRSSRTGTTYDLNEGDNYTEWDTDGINGSVTKVVFDPSFAGARPTTTSGWFYGMTNLQSITGLNYLNTSEVTDMSWMFNHCNDLTSLDLSNFNTSNVDRMTCMFYGRPGHGLQFLQPEGQDLRPHRRRHEQPGLLHRQERACGLCLLHVLEHDADVLLRQTAQQPHGHDLRPERGRQLY